jgi:hypothetical protein
MFQFNGKNNKAPTDSYNLESARASFIRNI